MKINNYLLIAWLVISVIGFADATYLAVNHFIGEIPKCTVVHGCEIVLQSKYSTIFGIPLALFGALYYFTQLVLVVAYINGSKEILLKFAARLSWVGLIVSGGLVYLMAQVIQSWCQFCLISATASLLLFITGQVILRSFKKHRSIDSNRQ